MGFPAIPTRLLVASATSRASGTVIADTSLDPVNGAGTELPATNEDALCGTWLSLAAVSALFVTGCNQSPEGGTPGSKNSFTIKGPSTTTHIKQNNKETMKLSLDRKSDFKKDVKLTVCAANGPQG